MYLTNKNQEFYITNHNVDMLGYVTNKYDMWVVGKYGIPTNNHTDSENDNRLEFGIPYSQTNAYIYQRGDIPGKVIVPSGKLT